MATHVQRGSRILDTSIDVAWATPPATAAVLSIMGVSISDAVSIVMLIWALALVGEKVWAITIWLRRKGWRR